MYNNIHFYQNKLLQTYRSTKQLPEVGVIPLVHLFLIFIMFLLFGRVKKILQDYFY